MTEDLSHKQVLAELDYDPTTGIFTWSTNKSNRCKAGSVAGCDQGRYWAIGLGRSVYLAHRLAWFYVTGRWPAVGIDHITGDRYDNRFCNLREATVSENARNMALRRDNRTGAHGVYRNAAGRWYAQSCHGGKNRHLGKIGRASCRERV